ncbi:hypothetical protein BJ508DRAFT_375010 [Ascobolus immersus RN42]|uniref:RNase H type-1 domain-containing protein n=1 Tax=Ascobolus immersus RN42 TaxID=1160509 RepID=A0A3N4IBK3_ASCIM|nr:hypothetical protein BJ508DRAFT_375010 [Ascobolus immersus RN42]
MSDVASAPPKKAQKKRGRKRQRKAPGSKLNNIDPNVEPRVDTSATTKQSAPNHDQSYFADNEEANKKEPTKPKKAPKNTSTKPSNAEIPKASAFAEKKPEPTLASTKLPRGLPCPCPNHYRYSETFDFPPVSSAVADANRHFIPSGPNKPTDIFHAALNRSDDPAIRFISKKDKGQMLIFVNGACEDIGRPLSESGITTSSAQGGCGIVLTSSAWSEPFSLPLEQDGTPHTDCRAEVRAALAAIGLKDWVSEGFDNVIVGTTSKYLYDGVERLGGYVKNGGKIRAKNGKKTEIKNKDVWFALAAKMRELEAKGVMVQFWLVPKEVNEAEPLAREAVHMESDECSAITDIVWVEREKKRMAALVNH